VGWELVLDHCAAGRLGVYYGAATALTGAVLTLAQRSRDPRLLRVAPYLRLAHVTMGAVSALLGLLTYLA